MNTTAKCEAIIKEAFKKGFIQTISSCDLRKIITQVLAVVDERTVSKWERYLFAMGYMERKPAPQVIYQWCFAKIPEIEIPQTTDPAQKRLFNA